MIHQRLRDKIGAGRPAYGLSMRFQDPALIELIGAGWDFCWIDMQHGTIWTEHLLNLVRACDLVGLTSLVRLPQGMPEVVSFVLDMDAGGVIVAQTDTVAQGRAMVEAARFPPVGDRSFGGRRIIDRHGKGDYPAKADREQLLFLQIESPRGLATCDDLASLEGVSGLMLGPDDMRIRLGMPVVGPLYEGAMAGAARTVTDACRRHGKLALGFGGATPEAIRAGADMGFQLLTLSADALFLIQGSAACLEAAARFEQGL